MTLHALVLSGLLWFYLVVALANRRQAEQNHRRVHAALEQADVARRRQR